VRQVVWTLPEHNTLCWHKILYVAYR
jgi:hypothetical protein